jgi:hypothetical protein
MIYYYDQFVGIFENVFSKEECQNIITFFDNSERLGKTWTRKLSERNVSKLKKDDSTYFIEFSEQCFTAVPFLDSLNDKIYACYDQYRETYDILGTLSRHSCTPSIRIQKTNIGGGYHSWHCEHANLLTSARLIAWTLYLNDVDHGGETEFLYQHMRVPAKQGSVCLFPSAYTHAHRGNPPLSNEKYIVTSWLEFNE